MLVQIRNMSEGQLISLWSMYVGQLQELLQAGRMSQQDAEKQHIIQRITTLQREATLISIRYNIIPPPSLCRILGYGVQHRAFLALY